MKISKMTVAPIFYGAAMMLAGCSGSDDKASDNSAGQAGEEAEESVAAAVPDISVKPGQWESTVEIVDAKMDLSAKDYPEGADAIMRDALKGMKGRTRVFKHCISVEEAKNPGAKFFATDEDADCQYDKFLMKGGKIEGEIICTGKAEQQKTSMTMRFNGSYTETSYQNQSEISSDMPKLGKMQISSKSSGKYLGECTEK